MLCAVHACIEFRSKLPAEMASGSATAGREAGARSFQQLSHSTAAGLDRPRVNDRESVLEPQEISLEKLVGS